jgi:hypothetical protein
MPIRVIWRRNARSTSLTNALEVISAISLDVAVLEMGEDERGARGGCRIRSARKRFWNEDSSLWHRP